MSKLRTINEVVDMIQDGDVVMVGGFLNVGSPMKILAALAEKGTKDLTLICNDTSFIDSGVGKMVSNKQFKKIIATHIGTNKETGRQLLENETEVVLVPQGTLVEQIRAAGYGLGGVLTATGLGTAVAEGKEVITVLGKQYLLEEPLTADVAIIFSNKADEIGNMRHHGSTQNFNHVMATAAKLVLLETDEVVSIGDINPDDVHTPGIFVDYIVDGGQE